MSEGKKDPVNDLPIYRFSKGSGLGAHEQATLVNELVNKDILDNPRTDEYGKAWEEFTKSLTGHMALWFKESFGLNVNSRLNVAASKIKFYDSSKFSDKYSAITKAEPNRVAPLGAAIPLTRETLIPVIGNSDNMSNIIAHELIHQAHNVTFILNGEDKGNNQRNLHTRSGLSNVENGQFELMDEVVTEMTKVKFISDFQKKPGLSNIIQENILGYAQEVLFFDLLMKEAAKRLNTQYGELLKKLVIASVKGNIKELNFIDNAFGKGKLKILASLRRSQSNSQDSSFLKKYCEEFGINKEDYVLQCDNYGKGQVQIMDGINVVR